MALKASTTVNKKDLIKTIAERSVTTTGDASQIIQALLDQVIEILSEGNRIELRGFGIFEPKFRKARIGRNPKTGETVNIPEKAVVTFKPGKIMKERVFDLHKRKPDLLS